MTRRNDGRLLSYSTTSIATKEGRLRRHSYGSDTIRKGIIRIFAYRLRNVLNVKRAIVTMSKKA